MRPRGRRAGEHVGEAHLAGLVDDQDVEHGLRPCELGPAPRPGHGADDVDRRAPASAASTSALPLSTIAAACGRAWPPFGFWPIRTGPVELDGGLGHLVEHVADDLVAVGDDADALPLGDEVHDHPRPGVGLARARWPLDRQRRRPASPARSASRRRRPSRRAVGAARPGPARRRGGVRSSRSRTDAGTGLAGRRRATRGQPGLRDEVPRAKEALRQLPARDDALRHDRPGQRHAARGSARA